MVYSHPPKPINLGLVIIRLMASAANDSNS